MLIIVVRPFSDQTDQHTPNTNDDDNDDDCCISLAVKVLRYQLSRSMGIAILGIKSYKTNCRGLQQNAHNNASFRLRRIWDQCWDERYTRMHSELITYKTNW